MVLLKFFIFAFSAPLFSMGETLHVAYKKYKIKREFLLLFFFGKYQIYFILKLSELSLMLGIRENADVFNTLGEIYLVITSKE